ncbi:hypothetical protein C7271_10945 [filamentous cyanobacterium CCP5]|nr:hypothetical protein C7271_10945 [filamentous cyanobacterium CCP5]
MQPKTVLLISALGSLVLGAVHSPSALGQTEAIERLRWPTEFTAPDLADRRRPDGRSRGGASRGGCQLTDQQPPLTALVPSMPQIVAPDEAEAATQSDLEETVSEVVLSQTTQDRPGFWFYVPYTLDGDLPLEFVLQDGDGNTLYQTKFVSETNDFGIVRIVLPETAPALELAAPYRWFFMAYCDRNAPTFVEGWIERVEIAGAMQRQLDQVPVSRQVALYAEQGIWQDALDTLGVLYRQDPQTDALQADWVELLTSAGLEAVAAEDFVGDEP